MEIEALLAEAGGPRAEREVEVQILEIGLHNEPEELHEEVQRAIDATDAGSDYILLAYGICSNGLAGITARDVPLIIPRAHDCITFFLGSKERYSQEFAQHPGTHYYTCGWIEDKEGYQEEEESMLRSRQDAARRSGKASCGPQLVTDSRPGPVQPAEPRPASALPTQSPP